MAYRKLGRNSSNRKAMFRSIMTAFFKKERIETDGFTIGRAGVSDLYSGIGLYPV